MNRMKLFRSAVFALCMEGLISGGCLAGDEKREAEFAESIGNTLTVGKAVWLESEGKKFLGVYTETERTGGKGTVIILHDIGGHPNQQPLIYGLRVFLPEHHWTTLALLMPLWEAGIEEQCYGEAAEMAAALF